MLAMRRRGKAPNFSVRGSVTLGERSIVVAEYVRERVTRMRRRT